MFYTCIACAIGSSTGNHDVIHTTCDAAKEDDWTTATGNVHRKLDTYVVSEIYACRQTDRQTDAYTDTQTCESKHSKTSLATSDRQFDFNGLIFMAPPKMWVGTENAGLYVSKNKRKTWVNWSGVRNVRSNLNDFCDVGHLPDAIYNLCTNPPRLVD